MKYKMEIGKLQLGRLKKYYYIVVEINYKQGGNIRKY